MVRFEFKCGSAEVDCSLPRRESIGLVQKSALSDPDQLRRLGCELVRGAGSGSALGEPLEIQARPGSQLDGDRCRVNANARFRALQGLPQQVASADEV